MNTVNVIEMVDGGINRLSAFADTKEGNKKAEQLFTRCAIENRCSKKEIDVCIEDGYYEDYTYKLFLIHSTK